MRQLENGAKKITMLDRDRISLRFIFHKIDRSSGQDCEKIVVTLDLFGFRNKKVWPRARLYKRKCC